MENQILDLILTEIKQINARLSNLEEGQVNLKEGQVKLEEGQARLESEMAEMKKLLHAVVEQTADLTEFKTDTTERLILVHREVKELREVVKENLFDTALLKQRHR